MTEEEVAWTWEATIRSFELAAEVARTERAEGQPLCERALALAYDDVGDERSFRDALDAAGFDSERIEAEVKRLFALVAS